jgi:hypothetical protein
MTAPPQSRTATADAMVIRDRLEMMDFIELLDFFMVRGFNAGDELQLRTSNDLEI